MTSNNAVFIRWQREWDFSSHTQFTTESCDSLVVISVIQPKALISVHWLNVLDKIKSLAIMIKHPPTLDYNQPKWDIFDSCYLLYLGSITDSAGGCLKNTHTRIAAAAAAMFQALLWPLWGHCDIKLATKLQIYTTTVITTLLFGHETQALRKAELKIRLMISVLLVPVSCSISTGRTRSEDIWSRMQQLPRSAQLSLSGHITKNWRWTNSEARIPKNTATRH